MAKMVKDTAKSICKVCGEEQTFARVYKTWADPSDPKDRPYRGMISRCKCGTLDSQGRDVSAIVDK